MRKFALAAAMAALVVGVSGTPAKADGRTGGSLLVYPTFDSRAGISTVITVTNTSRTESVWVEYHYIDGLQCRKSDRSELLTPADTLTVIASAHNPESSVGYVYLFAKDGQFGEPVSFNNLIGQASAFDGIDALKYSYNAYVFEAIPAKGQLTDLDDDGVKDLDGREYEMAPDIVLHPRFLGQAGNGAPGFESRLYMINLTGGTEFSADVMFLIYNDNERQFSRSLTFRCWTSLALSDISGAFDTSFLRNSGDDEEEIFGADALESGWFEIDGIVANSSAASIDDPAILTLLVEGMTRNYCGADLPYQLGLQDNGDLLPRGVHGDS